MTAAIFIPNYIPLHGCSSDDTTRHFFPIIGLYLRGSCRQTQDWYCVRKKHCEASARTSLYFFLLSHFCQAGREKPRHMVCAVLNLSCGKKKKKRIKILGNFEFIIVICAGFIHTCTGFHVCKRLLLSGGKKSQAKKQHIGL